MPGFASTRHGRSWDDQGRGHPVSESTLHELESGAPWPSRSIAKCVLSVVRNAGQMPVAASKLLCVHVSIVVLAGCATFAPLVLRHDRGPQHIADLVVPAAPMPAAQPRHHVSDPPNGLDVIEVAMLAVVNRPGLKVAPGAATALEARVRNWPAPPATASHGPTTARLPSCTNCR